MRLQALDWNRRVRQGMGIWICVDDQRLYLVKNGRILRRYRCSTARRGVGNQKNSNCTPQGWHSIGEKIGDGLPLGAVLRSRKWTGRVWKAGDKTSGDLILTRILRLSGLEDDVNRGGDVDTWERMIYIHGTNAEGRIGTPVSKGCIRMRNRDVVELFELVNVGCRVLISGGT